MLLQIPSLDVLRFALAAGLLPASAVASSASVGGGLDTAFTLELSGRFTKDLALKLSPFGIVAATDSEAKTQSFETVLELFCLEEQVQPPQVSPQTPVLFQLPDASRMPVIVRELLRLGNDRIGMLITAECAFLKVIGPPYYTLLRAMDRSSSEFPMTAYVEAAPRVWVQSGYEHPFAKQIAVPESQLLLLAAQSPWKWLKSPEFEDVYQALSFDVAAPKGLRTSKSIASTITVPLRLTAGNATNVPEMWVFDDDALGQLDRFVRDNDAKLLEQLAFAVAEGDDGTQTVLFRTRPGVKSPPVLTLAAATGYRSFWRLPNLFLPSGTRLQPMIRRDAVAKLLANDPERVVWLSPGEAGAFTPRCVPENGFRPLSDWVDYVITANSEALSSWIAATVFDFGAIVCTEVSAATPRHAPEAVNVEMPAAKKAKAATRTKPAEEVTEAMLPAEAVPSTVPVVKREPSEWKLRCDELEKTFLAIDGPLDDPRRDGLWQDLAAANAALGEDRRHEGMLCRLNHAWKASSENVFDDWRDTEPMVAIESVLKRESPAPAEMRLFAVQVLTAKTIPNLPQIQSFFEEHDDRLPVRAAWLMALKLSALGGNDVLGLARCRDRLLARLLERGLSPELDVPAFLRFAGLRNSEQARLVRDRMPELQSLVRKWIEAGKLPTRGEPNATADYCDLAFAFALATLGDTTIVYGLIESARQTLENPAGSDDRSRVNTFLFRGYKHRIDEALAGRSPGGPLDVESQSLLQTWLKNRFQHDKLVHNPVELAVNRLREESSILEPHYRLDPYAATLQGTSELTKFLAKLIAQRDAPAFPRSFREAFAAGIKPHSLGESRLYLLHDVVSIAPAIGMDFTLELLEAVPAVLGGLALIDSKLDFGLRPGRLAAQSLVLGVHYDRDDLVPVILDAYVGYLRSLPAGKRFDAVNIMAADALRVLHRTGNRDLLGRFLQQMERDIFDGITITQLQNQHGHKPHDYAMALQSALLLAAGWMRLERMTEATAVLDLVRTELLSPRFNGFIAAHAALAKSYLNTLGHAPAEMAMDRILDFFQRFDAVRIADSQATAAYYYRFQLLAVENAVLALVGDDSTAGREGRRLMDEDELLVRKRILCDYQRVSDTQGL